MSDTTATPPDGDTDPHTAAVAEPGKLREPTSYELELRREAAAKQRKIKAMGDEHAAALTKAAAEAEARIGEAQTQANARVKASLLAAHAMRAGMVDPALVRLMDTSAVTLGDGDTLTIPEGFFDADRKARPYAYGAPASTSNPANPPPAGEAKPFNALTASPAELKQWKRAHGITV